MPSSEDILKSFNEGIKNPSSVLQSFQQGTDTVESPKPEEPVSTLEAIGRGAGQAAFGLGDEAIAAVRALKDSGKDDKKFGELYNQYLQEERDKLVKAAEQQPEAYYGSEIGGSFLIPLGALSKLRYLKAIPTALRTAGVLGATGALTGYGKSEAEDTGEQLKEAAFSGATTAALGPVLGKLGGAALSKQGLPIVGALAGGAAGAYQAGEGEDKTQEALKGAALGYLTGKGATALAPKVASAAEELPFLGPIIKSGKLGLEGKNAITAEGKKAISEEFLDSVNKNILDVLQQTKGNLDQASQALIERAKAEGIEVPTQEVLRKTLNKIKDVIPYTAESESAQRGAQKLVERLQEAQPEAAPISEAWEQKKALQAMQSKLIGKGEQDVSQVLGEGAKEFNDIIAGKVPEYAEQLPKYQKFYDTLEPLGLNSKSVRELSDPVARNEIQKEITNLVNKSTQSGVEGITAEKQMDLFLDRLKQIPGISPETISDISNNLSKAVNNYKVAQSTGTHGIAHIGFITGMGTWLSNAIGYGVKKLTDSAVTPVVTGVLGSKAMMDQYKSSPHPVESSQALFTADNQQLMDVATDLNKDDTTKFLGQALLKSISNQDEAAKNSILFAIAQNPKARKIFNKR